MHENLTHGERLDEVRVRAPRPRGRHLLVYDLIAITGAIVGALALRFDTRNLPDVVLAFLPAILLPLVVQPLANVAFGLYRREWRYASVRELVAIIAAVATGAAVTQAIILVLSVAGAPGTAGLPRSFVPLEALISLTLIGGGRFAIRVWTESDRRDQIVTGPSDSLVYGAGEAGAAIARIAVRDPGLQLRIVGFLDDDPAKRGSRLFGKPIFGDIAHLADAVERTGAQQLVVAMPSAPGAVIRGAVNAAQELDIDVRIVPPLAELLGAPDRVGRLRPVSVDDLLRRAPVQVHLEELAGYLNGACVLVTGAGGSIGSELARQASRLGPRQLVLVDNSEAALWAIERDLREAAVTESSGVVGIIADVRSHATVDRIIARHEPDVVFHAAALKHVPVCEIQPAEAVLTNVVGTANVLRACEAHRVGRFVLISTDKAVNSVNVMGATKRCAELLTLDAAHRTGCPHLVVRFGNVLGSSGSVVPVFQHQLERRRPLTITHPDATRYFMTIPEAVSLILQAGATAATGEIFVLDMGEPVRILDLAKDMVRLSGSDPASVEITFTGLRPGERLEERLFYDHENVEPTAHERVWRVSAVAEPDRNLDGLLDALRRAAEAGDDRATRSLLIHAGALAPSGATARA